MSLNRLVLLCAVVGILLWPASQAASAVRINEFMATSGMLDEDGDPSDWIEIYNAGPDAVDLSEWALTDDITQPHLWEFPSTPVPAGGYVLVFASGKNRTSPRLHTNFSLDAAGEYLALVMPDGTIADSFNPYPKQRDAFSYGYDLGNNLVFFASPTPGAANTSGVVDFVGDTKFSYTRGFYDAPFDVTITTATAGATIRYTTNGVPPTATTGLVYSAPLHITGTTVLRAAAFKTGLQPSNVDSETYIFLDDVIRQAPTGAPPPGWPSSWGRNVVDYGMDPDVVNDPKYSGTIKNDLKTIPSFSIVMNLNDLFNATTGVYANPDQDGRTWERPCSVELIYPDGTKGFQIDAGLRIRGGFSRSTSNPKHAFRFFFRDDYGAGKLKYPLFGNQGTDTFDGIDLRTFQNYSWSFQGDANGVFLRDQFSRDTQADMGYNSERGNYYHLYINGVYWGLYNTCERPEASYAATYFGGDKLDYDVIKVEAGPYTINATDGNMTAWTSLYNQAKAGLSTDAAYQKLLGNNPDGTPNPAYPVLLDIDNLIDYMLVIIYTGNLDAPISNFLSNTSPNNWYGSRSRLPEVRGGFRFFAHDSEHTLLPWDVNRDRTGPFSAGDTDVTKSSPQWIWQKLSANAEFRLRVADRIQKYFFNGGLLMPEKNRERFLRRKNQIDRAVVGESARWGDAKRAAPMTRDVEWVNAINDVLNNFLPQRTQIALNQLKAKNLYPAVAAPSFNQQGGNVNPAFVLTMSAPAGQIYFTLDGTDPRLMGDVLSSKAQQYTGPLTLNENAVVKARVVNGGVWSALNEADFFIIRTFKELMITEVMYNPPALNNIDGDEYEFIELKNVGAQELDLSGIQFTNGISYRFPNGTHLAAGDFYVLVSNPTDFGAKYPGKRIDGIYEGRLANSGEAIALIHAAGAPIAQFSYGDKSPWPTTADGAGFSLVPRVLNPNMDYNDPANWRASSQAGGSPGADDPPANVPAVIINEILTHTDPPQVDYIELFNPTGSAADLSGWYLTDDFNTPKKFRIPNNTSISASGYLTFDENNFNPTPGVPPSFALSSHGDQVYLFSADLAGNLTGYSQGVVFEAAQNGVSFGRYTNSVGDVLYPAQISLTRNALNSGARVGPIVINEIQYHPTLGGDEFIELRNITTQTVKLYDPANPTNTWKLAGVSFDFPQGLEIPANGLVVVTGTEPSLFRTKNNVPQSVPVLGPYTGNLQDNGELLELKRPDSPDVDTNGVVFIPSITVDAVRYNDRAPWPTNAAGFGPSLERIVSSAFGNDPVNWRASFGPASPGLQNDGNRLPIVNAGPDIQIVSATFPVGANIIGSASDDGLPNPPARLTYTWSLVSGPGVVQVQDPNQLSTGFSFPGVGDYVLRLTANDGELQASDDLTVSISRPLTQSTFVAKGSTWKYLDNGSDQGTAWSGLNFSDTSWKSGAAQLGYGDGDETTVTSYGPDTNNKFITTYLRKNFTVTGAGNVTQLTLNVMRDDGVVIYLNGAEVFRSNMPIGPVNYLTPASSAVGGADESTFYQTQLDPSVLREGNNLFAIELHQSSGASSDTSFDLELSGLANFSNQPPTANAGSDLAVTLPAAADLSGTATDDGLPNPPGVFTSTWTIVSGPGSVNFANANALHTTATFTLPGIYVLKLSVTDGEFTATDNIQINVTGGDAYTLWKSQHFTSSELQDLTISGDDADPDGDSFSNKDEFMAGTDPRDGSSYLRIVQVSREGADFVLTFEAVGDKSYTIQGADSLESTSWDRVVDLSPQGTTKPLDILDPVTDTKPHKFYRVVTPQETPPN